MEKPRYSIVSYEHNPANVRGVIRCMRCGSELEHVWTITDNQTGELIGPIGAGCVRTLNGYTITRIKRENDEYAAFVRLVEEDLDKQKRAREWYEVNEEMVTALENLAAGDEHYCPVAESLVSSIAHWGSLTEKQLALANKIVSKYETYASRLETLVEFYMLLYHYHDIKMSRFDRDLLNNVEASARQLGLTKKQMELVRSMQKKYAAQIAQKGIDEQLRESYEKLQNY